MWNVKARAMITVFLLAVFSSASEIDTTCNIHYCIAPLRYLAEGAAFTVIGNLAAWGAMIVVDGGEAGPGVHPTPGMEIYLYPIIYPVVGALSVDVVGRIIKRRGSFLGALGGGFVGVAGVLALWRYGLDWDDDSAAQNFILAVVTIPPLLSVVGYHVFAPRIDGLEDVGPGFTVGPMTQVRRGHLAPKITLQVLKIDL